MLRETAKREDGFNGVVRFSPSVSDSYVPSSRPCVPPTGEMVSEGGRFIPVDNVGSPMTDDTQTGPWVLALGTLAIGTAAMAQLLRRQRRRGEDAADDSLPQS